MENKVREAYLMNRLESRDEQIQGLKSDIHDLEQENKALKEKIETFEKNAQEYFFQMSLQEED